MAREHATVGAGELKFPREWEAIDGVKVIDPDGWSHGSYQSWGTPISREEWERRLSTSTIEEVNHA